MWEVQYHLVWLSGNSIIKETWQGMGDFFSFEEALHRLNILSQGYDTYRIRKVD
jgi:hypothetical protein